jgi:integrase
VLRNRVKPSGYLGPSDSNRIKTVNRAPHAPGIRETKSGAFELTITHALLPSGRAFRNFASEDLAVAYRDRMLAVLRAGVLPAELTRVAVKAIKRTAPPVRRPRVQMPVAHYKVGSQSPQLKVLLQAYLEADTAQIAKSDRPSVVTLLGEVDGRLYGVVTDWVDAWVRHMKRESRLAPGTIRKKVEALARAIDWWNRKEYQGGQAPPNVLRLLPPGYSTYRPEDVVPGTDAKHDRKRDRRLNPGEYEEIEAVLQGKHRKERQRPWPAEGAPDLLMLFRLIVHTGLRLREAYRLRVCDIKFNLRTIHVRRSKTGAARDVPTLRILEGWLMEYIGDRGPNEIVFPFWDGCDDEAALIRVSRLLSGRFSTLFKHCGCKDLTEHDLRHEATCRWIEKRDSQGGWLYRDLEVRRITGHKNVQMFERYTSLRGSDLADRLD